MQIQSSALGNHIFFFSFSFNVIISFSFVLKHSLSFKPPTSHKESNDIYHFSFVRYSFGGNPLCPVASVPKPGECKICGAVRRFELQLMPPLLYFLHEGADGSSDISIDGWAWLTIIICTCPEVCY